jgi:hypothetical protein
MKYMRLTNTLAYSSIQNKIFCEAVFPLAKFCAIATVAVTDNVLALATLGGAA